MASTKLNVSQLPTGTTSTTVCLGNDARLVYTGEISWGAVITAPTGWLLCDGSAVSRTTYATLFNAITIQQTGTTVNGTKNITLLSDTSSMKVGMFVSGPGIPAATTVASIVSATAITTSINSTASASGVALVVGPFGIGDGSTTFNVPDMRGRAPIGTGTGSGLTARNLGASGGEENHTLTTAELASHSHGGSQLLANSGAGTLQTPGGFTFGSGVSSTDSAGSGTAHNNMQPWRGLNAYIKT